MEALSKEWLIYTQQRNREYLWVQEKIDSKHKLMHTQTKEVIELTLLEILELINRDRSEYWTPFNEEDWEEGLEWTDWKLIKDKVKVRHIHHAMTGELNKSECEAIYIDIMISWLINPSFDRGLRHFVLEDMNTQGEV